MLGSSRVAAQLAASREGLGSMSERVREYIRELTMRTLQYLSIYDCMQFISIARYGYRLNKIK
jgi:hypothetical protein